MKVLNNSMYGTLNIIRGLNYILFKVNMGDTLRRQKNYNLDKTRFQGFMRAKNLQYHSLPFQDNAIHLHLRLNMEKLLTTYTNKKNVKQVMYFL